MTGWAKWSIGNRARNWSLTIQTNSICTTQNLSGRMRQTPLGFWDTNIRPNISQMTRPCNRQEKKKKKKKRWTFWTLFSWLTTVKFEESEKTDKYQGIEKMDMKMMVILIVIGTLGMVTKGLVQELEDLKVRGRVETIQTTALLRLARILRRVLETCCYSISSEKPLANTSVKNSKRSNNNHER